jgi:hypothetical protein
VGDGRHRWRRLADAGRRALRCDAVRDFGGADDGADRARGDDATGEYGITEGFPPDVPDVFERVAGFTALDVAFYGSLSSTTP